MLRLLGSLMVSAGCLGLGLWYQGQFRARIQHLHTMNRIMDVMMSEIRYHKSNLPECCRRVALRVEPPYRGVFEDVYEKMTQNTGENFTELFKERLSVCLQKLPIQKPEKEVFLQFASESGFEEGQMQLLSISQYRDRLLTIIQKAEAELMQKSKMALGLGAMSGVLLIIVLW